MKLVVLLSKMMLMALLAGSIQAQPQPKVALDKTIKKQTIEAVTILLDSNYVFPETAKKMNRLVLKNLRSGKYDKITDPEELAGRLTEDLRSVSHDLHLNVRYEPGQIAAMRADTQSNQVPPEWMKSMQRINYGFVKAEYLPGNVGYLELKAFTDPKLHEAGQAAISAMNYLANAQAVIFDLRKNGGGHPEMIQLLSSYLFAEPTHLNDIYERPGNTTQQYWSLPYISGSRRPDVPVYILTSNYTFSAAEEFSNNLKELKRATIVGENTGGGAHPVDFKIVNDLFTLSLPFGRSISPVSKTNWEGTGVIPHVKVPADSAFNTAYLMALDTLITKASDPLDRQSLKSTRLLKIAEFGNYRVPEEKLKDYAGSYGTRIIIYQPGQLYLARNGRPGYKLLPVSDASFLADITGARIDFILSPEGRATALDFTRPNGEITRSEKNQ
ncbi:MAG: S41 family peptidase [bacterium]|nr:S41 family peptidase [bacterium]